jgi:hypothetical protein
VNNKSYVMISECLLRLGSRDKEIFESSQPAKKQDSTNTACELRIEQKGSNPVC